jgi:hypothetical protein
MRRTAANRRLIGCRCISALFQVNAVSEHNGAIEREPRLRAVPRHELANRMLVGPLTAGRCQTVQHRCLRVFEVGKCENPFRDLLLVRLRLGHRRRPPLPSPQLHRTRSSARCRSAALPACRYACRRHTVVT